MKKVLLVSVLGAVVLAGCATTKAPSSVSYNEYKKTNQHDTELVSDKHYDSYAACVRNGLRSYKTQETNLDNKGTRISSGNHFTVEIYKAIDSTYARADSDDQKVIDVLNRCKQFDGQSIISFLYR